ncbi:hypothetical protein GCM10009416_38170 [Craurococcus roseus]|uniref:BON domain-containing protein n=1 Tax=Craurococcus roseus TaxID=77585 RepID=A0ABP3QVJ6_9PROT
MDEQPWVDPFTTFVEVEGGSVTIHGLCHAEEVKPALRVLAEDVVGAREVRLELAVTSLNHASCSPNPGRPAYRASGNREPARRPCHAAAARGDRSLSTLGQGGAARGRLGGTPRG